jgi:hypothetical protein
MNLQETYDLLGQILKERPELQTTTVVDIAGATIRNIALHEGFIYLNCFEEPFETTEVLWHASH